jgi:hypothetical protein
MARKAKARKCTAEIVGNIQAKVERQHRLVTFLSVISPARSNPQRYTKMCVVNPHNAIKKWLSQFLSGLGATS